MKPVPKMEHWDRTRSPGACPGAQSAENQIPDHRETRIFAAHHGILGERNSYGCPKPPLSTEAKPFRNWHLSWGTRKSRTRGSVRCLHRTSIQRPSLFGGVQFGNSIDGFVYFRSDAADIVRIASRINVFGSFHVGGKALSFAIFPERICPMLFLFE